MFCSTGKLSNTCKLFVNYESVRSYNFPTINFGQRTFGSFLHTFRTFVLKHNHEDSLRRCNTQKMLHLLNVAPFWQFSLSATFFTFCHEIFWANPLWNCSEINADLFGILENFCWIFFCFCRLWILDDGWHAQIVYIVSYSNCSQ